ncbi:diacylglycerol/lipid kinase family protein [Maritalea porphyrae]|uniref:Multidrug transporter n=1 Tax=Maritalea porphyrae TaxID=880732 RepID=A0ABQ5UNF8_9HYPH|nr:diacylglycerol kinase family protein [Maritalea porphyrae]GLQ15944.1 multidrug transporter [Maritalea porphyrae]
MNFAVLLNRDGGTLKTMDVDVFGQQAQALLIESGHVAAIHIVSGDELSARVDYIIGDTSIDAIVVGGGDGTVSFVAGKVWRAKKQLAVLPAGTMNLFARSIGMSLDLDLAVAQIANGTRSKVDTATANGQPFLHQFALGIQPRVVQQRDELEHRSRFGKVFAGISTFLSTIVQPPKLTIKLEHDHGVLSEKVSLLCVTNNLYGRGHIPHADRLDDGKIGIYWAQPLTTREFLKLTSDLLLGIWENNPNLTEIVTTKAVLYMPRVNKKMRATIDGELVPLERKTVFALDRQSLNVIKPE